MQEFSLLSKAGYSPFQASSGVSEASALLLARYDLSDRYRLLGLAAYGRLLGDAAKSPLTAGSVGSRNQFTVGIGFTIDY